MLSMCPWPYQTKSALLLTLTNLIKMAQFSQMTKLSFIFSLIVFIPKLVSCMVRVKPSISKKWTLILPLASNLPVLLAAATEEKEERGKHTANYLLHKVILFRVSN